MVCLIWRRLLMILTSVKARIILVVVLVGLSTRRIKWRVPFGIKTRVVIMLLLLMVLMIGMLFGKMFGGRFLSWLMILLVFMGRRMLSRIVFRRIILRLRVLVMLLSCRMSRVSWHIGSRYEGM